MIFCLPSAITCSFFKLQKKNLVPTRQQHQQAKKNVNGYKYDSENYASINILTLLCCVIAKGYKYLNKKQVYLSLYDFLSASDMKRFKDPIRY